jgi:hypothetical protein
MVHGLSGAPASVSGGGGPDRSAPISRFNPGRDLVRIAPDEDQRLRWSRRRVERRLIHRRGF